MITATPIIIQFQLSYQHGAINQHHPTENHLGVAARVATMGFVDVVKIMVRLHHIVHVVVPVLNMPDKIVDQNLLAT